MSKGLYTVLAILALLAVAAGLRFYSLDLMEFKQDEVLALSKTGEIFSSGKVPSVGLVSSVGIYNPPVFLYILALCSFLVSTPVGFALVVALGGMLAILILAYLSAVYAGRSGMVFLLILSAASPWMVIYSRKIWAQNLLLPLVALLVTALLRLSEKPRTRAAVLIFPLLALIFGLHFSGVAVAIATLIFIVLAVKITELNKKALLAGLAPAIAILSPYLLYLVKSGFSDLGAVLSAIEKIKTPILAVLYDSVKRTGEVFFIGGSNWIMDNQFTRAQPLIDGSAALLSKAGAWIVWFIVLLFGAGAFGFAAQSKDGFFAAFRERRAQLLCFLFVLTPVVFYGILGIKLYNHYFIISIPPVFLAVSIAFSKAFGETKRLFLPHAALFIRALIALFSAGFFICGALWLLTCYRYIESEGGTRGDYGEAFRYQAQAAEYILERSSEKTKVKYYSLRDSGVGVKYLIEESKDKNPQLAEEGAKEIRVINTLVSSRKCPKETTEEKKIGAYIVCRM
ncbi:MAG: hypothetical protein Kow0090_16780 [Myxococcota bacterium]